MTLEPDSGLPMGEGSQEATGILGKRIFSVVVLNLLLGLFVNWDRSYASVLVAVFVGPFLNIVAIVLGIADISSDAGALSPKVVKREIGTFLLAAGGAIGLFYLFLSSIDFQGC